MKLSDSLARLPEAIRSLIASDRAVKERLQDGWSLGSVLSSPEWAADWLGGAEDSTAETLKLIVRRFAGAPYELEALVKAGEAEGAVTGAEIRVAIARLRGSGVVFAVRKAWGDQLLYVPPDNVPLWQDLLMPVEARTLSEAESGDVVPDASAFRLPLSLELFATWCRIRKHPLPFTSKGALNRASVARLAASMRLSAEDLAELELTYPDRDQVPAQVALALDVGLAEGALRKTASHIRASEEGIRSWFGLSPAQADGRLERSAVARLASHDPGLHAAAAAFLNATPYVWTEEEAYGELPGGPAAADRWLRTLEAFGWAERGKAYGKRLFRKTIEPSDVSEEGLAYVQPDGEIVVPPDVRFDVRWQLELIAERASADASFVYRLSRESCAEACDDGFDAASITELLERASGQPLPMPVAGALGDWFESLGRTRLQEATLLRLANSEIADRLLEDEEIAELVEERIGDADFVVKPGRAKAMRDALRRVGFPPTAERLPDPEEGASAAEDAKEGQPGWLYRRHALEFFDADKTMPSLEELFPGMSDIPAAWIRQPRAYHASTRKEMLEKAIGWQTSVRMRVDGEWRTFVPTSLEQEGSNWRVRGRNPGDRGDVALPGDKLEELMISLPEWRGIESD